MARKKTENEVKEDMLKKEGLEGEKTDQAEEPEGEETDQAAQTEGKETGQAVPDRNSAHQKERMVETIVEYLRVRAGAGTHYVGVAILNEPEGKKKQHCIVKEKKGWGLLKEYQEHENGWYGLEFTRPAE